MIKRTRTAISLTPKLIRLVVFTACLPPLLTSCSFQKYSPQPIDSIEYSEKFELKNPSNEKFQQYLQSNGYRAEDLPIQQWGLDELTYCGLFFHPSLDVARAQLRVAQSTENIAAERPTPNVSGNVAHSNDPDPAKKPLAFGLSVDIPIETANKRGIRIENAQHLSQIAKLQIAQIAWQLRYNIAKSLAEFRFNQQQLDILTKESTRRQEIVAIYQKRVDLGAATNVELSTAKLQLQTSLSELNAKQQNKLVLISTLAKNIGLPFAKVETMHLASDGNILTQNVDDVHHLETKALLNRLDIRIALERYAIAETKLKLEIAKQYPDIVISPGAAYEFGDNIWSLGISGLLTLLNKNKLAIAEATQLREVESAQFDALQTQVLSEIDIANVDVKQAKQALSSQQALLEQQLAFAKRIDRKFAAGEIDRLESAFVKLESIAAEKNVVLADFQLKVRLNELENTLQIPLSAGVGVRNEP